LVLYLLFGFFSYLQVNPDIFGVCFR
ncbi:hypothetical protein AZ037_000275, partial [Klebsiella michiganensis]